MNGQIDIFGNIEEEVEEVAELPKSKETPVEVYFNDVLGFTCPRCLGWGKGKGWKYCPGCGQRLKFIRPQNSTSQMGK